MVESAALDERAQGENGLAATQPPTHAGALEPFGDQRLARRLNHPDDNAHRKGARLTVRYRHHPHYGESVELLRRDASSGSVRLVVRLPDGSPLTLQDWMTRPEAELFPTVLQPGSRLGRWRTFMTSCLTFSCPLIEQEEGTMGLNVPPEDAVRPGGSGRPP